MLYGGASYFGRHRKAVGESEFAITATSLTASVKADFNQLLAAYAADMNEFGATATRLRAFSRPRADGNETVKEAPMSDQVVSLVLKRYADAAGLDPACGWRVGQPRSG